MLELAKRRSLTRLERQAVILKMRGAYLRGHAHEVASLADEVGNWVRTHDLKTSPRDWQNHFIAVSNLAIARKMSPSIAASAVRQCILDGRERGASFFEIRLLVSEALLLWQLDKKERSIDALREALAIAAPQGVLGPFIGLEPLKPILGGRKIELSLNQENVLLVNFVSQIQKRRREMHPQSGNELLSAREQEILEQLAQGRSNKEIARRFELTENTVKFHLKNIYSKLEVNRRTEAVAVARQTNLID
jgi:LuxR family maltose regulon positive regulatory protein